MTSQNLQRRLFPLSDRIFGRLLEVGKSLTMSEPGALTAPNASTSHFAHCLFERFCDFAGQTTAQFVMIVPRQHQWHRFEVVI